MQRPGASSERLLHRHPSSGNYVFSLAQYVTSVRLKVVVCFATRTRATQAINTLRRCERITQQDEPRTAPLLSALPQFHGQTIAAILHAFASKNSGF